MASHLEVQLLTSPRPGAIAVIRLTGPRAWERATRFAAGLHRPLPTVPDPHRLYMARWSDDEGEVDEVIMSCAEHGDRQVVEICSHGSPVVVQRIIRALQGLGAELHKGDAPSLPAESRSLIQRECDELLLRAGTRRGALFLVRQREALPTYVRNLAQRDEKSRDGIEVELHSLLDRASFGIRLASGSRVALVGDVNAGKSTLCNALAGRPVALASEQAGTTRDWVSTDIAIDGFPITLLDTPGLRSTDDALESLAIARADAVISGADLRLLVIDASAPPSPHLASVAQSCASIGPTLIAANKIDAESVSTLSQISNLRSPIGSSIASFEVSALTGWGLDPLRKAILSDLGLANGQDNLPCPFTPRQAKCLRDYLDLPFDQRPSFQAWVAVEFDPG